MRANIRTLAASEDRMSHRCICHGSCLVALKETIRRDVKAGIKFTMSQIEGPAHLYTTRHVLAYGELTRAYWRARGWFSGWRFVLLLGLRSGFSSYSMSSTD